MSQALDVKQEKKSSTTDYFQSPKKKVKPYIVVALRKTFDSEIRTSLEGSLKKSFPQMNVYFPKNPRELERVFNRRMSILIIDDRFSELSEIMDLVKTMKLKKDKSGIPVLFFTEDETSLIEEYHKNLLIYQEVDNYIPVHDFDINHMNIKINAALSSKERRRSRRFKFSQELSYFCLSSNKILAGTLDEISVHGGILLTREGLVLKKREQLQIHIPIERKLPVFYGDILRLSACVQRVFMGGEKAAISWEHLSDQQMNALTSFVLEIAKSTAHL